MKNKLIIIALAVCLALTFLVIAEQQFGGKKDTTIEINKANKTILDNAGYTNISYESKCYEEKNKTYCRIELLNMVNHTRTMTYVKNFQVKDIKKIDDELTNQSKTAIMELAGKINSKKIIQENYGEITLNEK